MTLTNNPNARNRALGVDRPAENAERFQRERWLDKEPPCGSVVMTESASGTAFQRFFSDGLWHGTNGRHKLTWDEVGVRPGRLPNYRVLIYTAPQD